jgi:hypothetical protein
MGVLADLPADEIFVHSDVGFEMVVLYEYLLTAPKFLNPLNRVAFTLADLEGLEAQMQRLFGADCILYEKDSEEEEDEEGEEEEEEEGEEEGEEQQNDEDDLDWFDEGELISRLNTSIVESSPGESVRLIRLRVDIDMNDVERHSPRPALESVSEEEEEEEEDEFSDLSLDALPPRRTFQSLTDMYQDEDRETRMGEQLSLLQYLEYDAMGTLVQIMDMAYDQMFHRFVWQHTSLDVMDTVTSYLAETGGGEAGDVITTITEPSPSPTTTDYDLQVEYTSCWEVYRLIITENLERRYLATARDVLSVSVNDFRALLTSHRAHVRQRAVEHGVNYDSILDMLVRVAGEVLGRR